MNGKALVRLQETVKGMNDGEWRGYLAAKVEDIHEDQIETTKRLTETKKCLSKLIVTVAKIPPHCIQSEKIKEIDKKVDILNEDKAGRKAVARALWGSGGTISVLGFAYLMLRIFGVL
jgi:hypothetical protein